MTIRAVVFDLDGTLVEFKLDYKTLRADVINLLASRGLPRSLFSLKESVFNMLRKAEVSMRNNGKGEDEIREIRDAILSIADRYELEAARRTNLISGVIPTLKALKGMSLKMGLFTINGVKATEYILQRFRLKGFFDVIVPRDFVPSTKPDPAHLREALKKLGVKPEETLVVGDSEGDMACARELGATAVGIRNERNPPEKLRSAGATYIVSSLTEIVPLIERLTKTKRS